MLLPHEINKKEFTHAIGGYARGEVKSYLEYVAVNYEKLRRENDEISRKLDAACQKLDEYQRKEAASEAEKSAGIDNVAALASANAKVADSDGGAIENKKADRFGKLDIDDEDVTLGLDESFDGDIESNIAKRISEIKNGTLVRLMLEVEKAIRELDELQAIALKAESDKAKKIKEDVEADADSDADADTEENDIEIGYNSFATAEADIDEGEAAEAEAESETESETDNADNVDVDVDVVGAATVGSEENIEIEIENTENAENAENIKTENEDAEELDDILNALTERVMSIGVDDVVDVDDVVNVDDVDETDAIDEDEDIEEIENIENIEEINDIEDINDIDDDEIEELLILDGAETAEVEDIDDVYDIDNVGDVEEVEDAEDAEGSETEATAETAESAEPESEPEQLSLEDIMDIVADEVADEVVDEAADGEEDDICELEPDINDVMALITESEYAEDTVTDDITSNDVASNDIVSYTPEENEENKEKAEVYPKKVYRFRRGRKKAASFDDDAELLLEALKLQYQTDSGDDGSDGEIFVQDERSESDNDAETEYGENDFEMKDYDEFNFTFADMDNKVDTVPTEYNINDF